MGDFNGLCSSVLLSTGSASNTEEGNVDEPVAFHPSGPPTYRSSQLSENGSPFTPGPIGLSIPDRPAYSLPDRLASSLGTHRFAEAIFGFEIRHRKLLQRRLRARPVLGVLHRDHHQKGPSEETVHRETLKQFLASKNELHFVPQTETVFGEKWKKMNPGRGGKVTQAWGER